MQILNKNQKTVLEILAQSPLKEIFYWTGGTLLSYYYLKHRLSEDIELFTDQKFNFEKVNPFVQKLKQKINAENVQSKKIHDRYELFFENRYSLRIEFVYYNHEKKRLEELKENKGIFIDSLTDIAANKTLALFDRNEPKDLFDLYFILTKKDYSVEQLLRLTKEKFGVSFDKTSFWSESYKLLPLLKNLKPLMLEEDKKKQQLLDKIEKYVKNNSREFLHHLLN